MARAMARARAAGASAAAGARAGASRRRRADRACRRAAMAADVNGDAATAERVENVVVIGSGPAGYTAAIYASRANLRPVVFEGLTKGGVPGGQLMTTTEVENFPGFPDGITGPDLMDRMRGQAERWGSELVTEDVEEVDLSQRPFVVRSTERTVQAHSLIIATGATARRLGIPSEHEFWTRGISACAICDGAAPIFKGKELAVVGGGDTALEEALYLLKYASRVHLLVRSDHMRASKAMIARVHADPRVVVHLNTTVEDAYGGKAGGLMEGLRLVSRGETSEAAINGSNGDAASDEERKWDLPVAGLFYGIGHTPNSDMFVGQLDLDEAGYMAVKPGTPQTSMEGVFACGDLVDTQWRQAVTAAGSGCSAAISAERYLAENALLSGDEDDSALAKAHGAHAEDASADAGASASGGATDSSDIDVNATKHAGQRALRKLYHESDRLIAVMYTAPTCGPCRMLKPILNKVINEYDGAMHYVEIDIVEDEEIAQAAGVVGTPCVQFFKAKEKVGEMKGVKQKREYRELINQHVKAAATEAEVVKVEA